MKYIGIAAAIAALFMINPALAGSRSDANANSNSQSGAQVNINSHGYKGTGAAIAPGLIASGLSCSGSVSAGGGWMGGGFSLGFTRKDKDCDTRENAKIIAIMREGNTAFEMMCAIPEVREADRRSGRNRCVANHGVAYGGKGAKYVMRNGKYVPVSR